MSKALPMDAARHHCPHEKGSGSFAAIDYLSELRKAASAEHPILDMLQDTSDKNQRVYFHDFGAQHPAQPSTVDDLIALIKTPESNSTVCIIENICVSWIARLGSALDLDKRFFLNHATSPTGDKIWNSVMSRGWNHAMSRRVVSQDDAFHRRKFTFIEGVIPCVTESAIGDNRIPRRCEWEYRYGWAVTTRISYYRVSEHSYLFLVDTPFQRGEPDQRWLHPSKLSAWTPHSKNRGGLSIPQLYSMDTFAPFELLQNFLSHPLHCNVLFRCKQDLNKSELLAVDADILAQFLSASTYRTNVDHIDRVIKTVAFRDIRKPDFQLNNVLTAQREDLENLRTEVKLANDWLLYAGHFPHHFDLDDDEIAAWPRDHFALVLDRAEQISRFLMDTFQLLMSSISILDSQQNIQDAKRATLLTQLATFYVPLSFISSVWAMNIKGIAGDEPRPVWEFVLTLVIALAVTAAVLALLRYWTDLVALLRRRRRPRDDQRSTQT